MQACFELFGMAITFVTRRSNRSPEQKRRAPRRPTEREIQLLMEESTAAAVLMGSWQDRNSGEYRNDNRDSYHRDGASVTVEKCLDWAA